MWSGVSDTHAATVMVHAGDGCTTNRDGQTHRWFITSSKRWHVGNMSLRLLALSDLYTRLKVRLQRASKWESRTTQYKKAETFRSSFTNVKWHNVMPLLKLDENPVIFSRFFSNFWKTILTICSQRGIFVFCTSWKLLGFLPLIYNPGSNKYINIYQV